MRRVDGPWYEKLLRLMREFRDCEKVRTTAAADVERIRSEIKAHCNALPSNETR